MDCHVSPSTLKGTIHIPSSKSQSLRAVLFASLAHGSSTIHNLLDSTDVSSMVQACRMLGAQITDAETGITVTGTGGLIAPPTEPIDAGNSGIVLRFLAAVAALSQSPIVITGDHSIRHQRPMQSLLDALKLLGASAESIPNNGFAPIRVHGPLTHSHTTVEGMDSQPVSALLILGAFSQNPLEINVLHPGEVPWVNLTLRWLDFLKIPYIRDRDRRYRLGGGPQIHGFHYTVPGDMSSAAFAATAAVIKGTPLTIHGLDFCDGQGDKRVFDILEKMGAKLVRSPKNRSVEIYPGSKLKGITVDLNDCIDAICILAVAACYAKGETLITNAANARTKECNRIQALVTELSKMGATIKETDDGLWIKGSPLHGAEVCSHGDHRMAMALAVAALGAEGNTQIKETECIQKTYPTFILDFKNAGAQIDEHPS